MVALIILKSNSKRGKGALNLQWIHTIEIIMFMFGLGAK